MFYKMKLTSRQRLGSGLLGIFLLKFFYPTSSIKKHLFACIKGMGSRANLYFYDRIFLSIRPGRGFLGLQGGPAQELEIA